jgi:hypothetical protein
MMLGNLFHRNKNTSMPDIPGVGPVLLSPKKTFPKGIVITVLAAGVLVLAVFSIWAYGRMTDYKNNSDQKAAAAVTAATAEQKITLDAQFAEQSKSPLKTYTSPAEYGSVVITYPKTWSAYVDPDPSGNAVVDGYFYPDYLPSVASDAAITYSLRVQINEDTYQEAVDDYQTSITQGKLTATPFAPTAIEGASAGLRLSGQLTKDKRGAMIIIPLRDKVLKIWTESEAGIADFDNYVIPNLTFSP